MFKRLEKAPKAKFDCLKVTKVTFLFLKHPKRAILRKKFHKTYLVL